MLTTAELAAGRLEGHHMVAQMTGLEAEEVGCPIIEGAEYVYIGELPVGCRGHRYLLHRGVIDVPSYQHKVLVEALTGEDKGLWFTCSLANFAIRYKLVGCN